MTFQDKLIQLRKNKGWTKGVAARNISIQQSYLSKLENGHHIPSEEVIDKLCVTYNVTRKDLMLETLSAKSRSKYTILSLMFGLTILISGYFGLVFPQTYYTYRASPIALNNPSALSIEYYVSDTYRGESYKATLSSNEYEYVLIAERDILRDENRWLVAIGLFIALMSFGYFIINKSDNS